MGASLRSACAGGGVIVWFCALVWFCCWFCFFCVFVFGVCWWWCGCWLVAGLLESVGVAVASGGVGVGFDVGLRVFVLSGAGVPVFGGSASGVGVRASGSVVEDSASGGSVSSSDVLVSVPVDVAGGVAVCVPCAVRVFGDGWCFLVLRRWARAAGVDVGES